MVCLDTDLPVFFFEVSAPNLFLAQCQTTPAEEHKHLSEMVLHFACLKANHEIRLMHIIDADWMNLKGVYGHGMGAYSLESLIILESVPQGMPAPLAIHRLAEISSASRRVYIVTENPTLEKNFKDQTALNKKISVINCKAALEIIKEINKQQIIHTDETEKEKG